MIRQFLLIAVMVPLLGQSKPTTREMNLIGWLEFKDWVPSKIETVLLPVGTLEPHGVLPNGSDNLAPEAMASEMAASLNALIAPTLNYGVTGSMAAFPGAFAISGEAYGLFIEDILTGLAGNGFLNIIIVNGHGGPQSKILSAAADKISTSEHVRILVINWWSLASQEVYEVFGENGGHAGNNETAYIQAIVPKHVHPERYDESMAIPYPSGSAWHAAPFPSSIGLYETGQGYPTFDKKKSTEYYKRVNATVLAFVKEVIGKWDAAGLYQDDR